MVLLSGAKIKVEKYWAMLEELEEDFYRKLYMLENKMRKETGIKDLEFFWADNEIVGIGNESRTMKLIHR